MGTALSSNVANSAINNTTDIVSNSYQNCQLNSSEVQQIAVEGCKNVTIDNNYFQQFYALSASCTQNNQIDQSLQNNMQQQAMQLASSISQQFGLGIEDAMNLSNQTVNLLNEVQNNFT